VSLDRDRDAERTLDWNGVDAELQLLEQQTVAVVIDGSGRSRVSVIGLLRRIELPFDRCLGFAVAQAVVTLDEDDLVHAQMRTLRDGHFVITLQLRGIGAVLLGDLDLLTGDYEENPFPDDPRRDRDG
jgi:hypothetical protein